MDSLVNLQSEVFLITNPRLSGNPIIYVDWRFAEYVGYSVDEMIGRNPSFLQGTQYDMTAKQIVEDSKCRKVPRVVSVLNFKKDSVPFRNTFLVEPHYQNEELVYFVGKHLKVDENVMISAKRECLAQQQLKH
jgi:HTH-type transcriptional regulator, bacterioopsin transcriptional activator and related proteins